MAKSKLCTGCTGQWKSIRCSMCPYLNDEFNDYPNENRHGRKLTHDKNNLSSPKKF